MPKLESLVQSNDSLNFMPPPNDSNFGSNLNPQFPSFFNNVAQSFRYNSAPDSMRNMHSNQMVFILIHILNFVDSES